MGKTACSLCGKLEGVVAKALGVCLDCIRSDPDAALPVALKAHRASRILFGLPQAPPDDPAGVSCGQCIHSCRIPEGGRGFCGLRLNRKGVLEGAFPLQGKFSWYHDPLPTNCVADWVCAGGSGAGHPRYANRPGPERGWLNLAVFYHSCTFNCLYCQNSQFRQESVAGRYRPMADLLAGLNERISCICHFGGDPASQMPFAIRTSEEALARNPGRILRVCWETNGSMEERLAEHMMDLSLASGGCVKVDLKAFSEPLHAALTGVSNRRTLENFARLARRIRERPVPPPLVASTTVVPGYIDAEEISRIAGFIAALDPTIPYALLAFQPQFVLSDLPPSTREIMDACLDAARGRGLTNVRIGNAYLIQ